MKMKKLILVCAVLMTFSIAAGAQDYPKVEVFAGYSFLHTNVRLTETRSDGFNLNGGSASIAFNPTAKLGLVADFGGYHGSPTIDFPTEQTRFSFLFGPKVAMRSDKLTPFAHALLAACTKA